MSKNILGRRAFIQWLALGGLLSVGGCSVATKRPMLGLPKGLLPQEFLETLPSPWRYQFLQTKPGLNLDQLQGELNVDLIAVGDGWLKSCPQEAFQLIGSSDLYARLNSQANMFLNSLKPTFTSDVLPIAFSPWAMIFRTGEDFLDRASKSWEVLLDPKLKGEVILPNSPRIVMSLAARMSFIDSLRRLRLQVRSFDDRNAMNWLLSGKAKVAVLPLQYCLDNLIRDPRLSIALPQEGSPLNWTLLLRPKTTIQPLPASWIKDSWRKPLLVNLLVRGVIPPLPYSELTEAISSLPERFQSIYNFENTLENSWSLPFLNPLEEKALETRWMSSSP